MSERDSRMEIIGESATNALLPNLDSTRTVGLVTLPGAFVGVLLSTGSATQAGAVQILVLIAPTGRSTASRVLSPNRSAQR